ILPKSYVVLAENGDPTQNGGVTVSYVYSGFTLSNLTDQIILLWNNQPIDQVLYTKKPNPNGFDLVAGYTESLDPGKYGEGSDAPNWCLGKKPWIGSKGDFGSPGKANPSCANPCIDPNTKVNK